MASRRGTTNGSAPGAASVTLPTESPLSSSDSTPPQETNEAHEARRYLKTLLTGQDLDLSEKPRRFVIPTFAFYELLNEPGFDSVLERLKRKISYDARKSILTIFPMSGQRHGYILDWLHKVAVSASLTLDPWICRRVFFINNTKFYQFEGEWDGSLKFPDFTVAWRNDVDGPDLHTVVEVGCSQSRDSLLEVRDAYLRGMPSLSRFISINVIETPEYVSPKNIDIDELREVKIKAIQSDSDKGSAWYKGIQWVGETTISWEVWERDPTSGEPVQVFEATVDPNDSEGRLPFFEIPRIMALGVEAVTVKPADIHDFWQMAIKEEAKLRIWEYVADVEKRRKSAADIAEQKDEATKTRQKRNEERTERWERRSER